MVTHNKTQMVLNVPWR